MAQSRAAEKVGAVLVLATATLLALGYFFFGRAVGGYPVDVTFQNAQGINEQADVLYAGVKVGTVQKISVDDLGRAWLRLRIKPDQNIPRGSTFVISSGGLLGEMAVMITPPAPRVAATQGYLPRSEEDPADIQGKDLVTFDEIKEQVAQLGTGTREVLSNLEVASSNLAQITQDPVMRSALRNTIRNAETVSGQGTEMAARVNTTLGRIDASVLQLSRMIEAETPTLQAALRNVELATRQGQPLAYETRQAIIKARALIDDLGATSQFIRETLDTTLQEANAGPALNRALTNLADASAELKAVTANARKISDDLAGTDPATTKVGSVVTQVGGVATKADALLTRISGVTGRAGRKRGRLVNGTAQIELNQRVGGDSRFRADGILALSRSNNSAILLGLRDIGEGNRLILQNSVPMTDTSRLRYGFFASKLSLGADWNITGNPVTPLATSPPGATSLSLDIYDPNHTQLDLHARHQVNDKLGLVLGVEDMFDDRHPTLGLTYRP